MHREFDLVGAAYYGILIILEYIKMVIKGEIKNEK